VLAVPLRQRIAAAALMCGLGLSLLQLWQHTFGTTAILALSTALMLIAFCKRPTTTSGVVIQSFILLVAMTCVAVSSGTHQATGSGLVWAGVLSGLVSNIGLIRLSLLPDEETGSQTEEQQTEGQRLERPDEFLVDQSVTISETVLVPSGLTALELLASEDDEEFLDEELEEADVEGERIVHAWTRRRQPEEELLEGSVVAEFLPGQKQVYIHVPFLPGFASPPHALCYCECDTLFAAEFDILQTYGGRLSVRRRGDVCDSAEVEISFSVNAPRHITQRAA